MDQSKALAEYGHKVVFAAIDVRSIRRWRRWGLHTRVWKSVPVFEYNFPIGPILPNFREKISKHGFARVLNKVIKQFGKPDIVHAHFSGTAKCVVEACKAAGIPYVVTEHSSGVNRDDLNENEISELKYVYGNAARVIAVSSPLANRIKDYTGVNAIVVPNIVDLSTFSVNRKTHKGFKIVSAGGLDYRKGFDVLMKAFVKFSATCNDASLIIMGDGPARDSLEGLASELEIREKFRITGQYVRSEFAQELSQSDVFVLASRRETFGVVYAEALACGVPVIATRCGGPEDFVNDSNGILFDVDDVDGLAKAMGYMHDNVSLFNSEKIREDVQMKFSANEIAKELSEVFEKYIL
jgi:glycosyltransferase involved in cell wall biosynthesis